MQASYWKFKRNISLTVWQTPGSDIERQYSTNASDRCKDTSAIEFICNWVHSSLGLGAFTSHRVRETVLDLELPVLEQLRPPEGCTHHGNRRGHHGLCHDHDPGHQGCSTFDPQLASGIHWYWQTASEEKKTSVNDLELGAKEEFHGLEFGGGEKRFECYTDLLGTFIPFCVLFLLILVRTLPPYSQMSNTLSKKRGAIHRLCATSIDRLFLPAWWKSHQHPFSLKAVAWTATPCPPQPFSLQALVQVKLSFSPPILSHILPMSSPVKAGGAQSWVHIIKEICCLHTIIRTTGYCIGTSRFKHARTKN